MGYHLEIGPMSAPHAPQIIAGRYALLRELTRGGMGAVWVGHDRSLDREVAVKLMLPASVDQAASRARFEREAKAIAGLASQHVVQIFDFGVDEGAPFLVMELLRGEDLGARLRRVERLSLAELQAVCVQIAKALTAAHDAGLIHRDLKPGNVFLARIDTDEIVKVLDFGIAKVHDAPAGALTATGAILGTPHYMSPEQFRSAKAVDHRSDLWSLGVLLFQGITGTPAFSGESLGDVIFAISVDPLPVPSRVCPDLPDGADAFFARAFERDPARRFQSAREMADAFSKLTAGSSDQGDRSVAIAAGTGPAHRDVATDAETVHTGPLAPTSAREPSAGPPEQEELIAFVEWDDKEGVATVLLKPDAVGRTFRSIETWKRQVSSQLERFGRKVPLLICVDGGVVSPSLAEEFGSAAKEIIDRYATRFARYGNASGLRMISAVESMKRGYKPNLFNDRASALAFVKSDTSSPGSSK